MEDAHRVRRLEGMSRKLLEDLGRGTGSRLWDYCQYRQSRPRSDRYVGVSFRPLLSLLAIPIETGADFVQRHASRDYPRV